MRRTVVLTHTLKPDNAWFTGLQSHFQFHWIPFVKEQSRSQCPSLDKFSSLIISSPTSLSWLLSKAHGPSLSRKTFYFVGSNTAFLFQKALSHHRSFKADDIVISPCNTMSSLLELYGTKTNNKDGKCLWLGSSFGLKKHAHALAQYSTIDPQITHWNWPRVNFNDRELQLLAKCHYLIVSSMSSALAFEFLDSKFHAQPTKIFSDRRLIKYLSSTPDNCVFTRWPEYLGSAIKYLS